MNTFAAAACALAGALLCAPAAGADVGVGWIELDGAYPERPDAFSQILGAGEPTLRDVIHALENAAERDDLEAVVLRLHTTLLATAQIEEIAAAMRAVRDAGKKIHVFAEIYGPAELLLAAHADEIIMQRGGALSFPGLYAEELFLADALRWIGVEPSYVQVGAYKGAEEMFANSEPSKPWSENYERLLDELYAAMRNHLTEGRGMSDAQLDRAMEDAWFADGAQAKKLRLIDAEIDRLDMDAHLEKAYGEPISYDTDLLVTEASSLDMANPFAIFQLLSTDPRPRLTRDTIAVVHINGPIMDGASQPGSILGGATVGSLTVRQALAEIEDEPRIKGVIVRIDSPGGSAIASESIWLGLRRVAEKKPVWTSVGTMAASGGYYIAVAGERIYVNPSSVVGSIGVVAGKLALGGVYEKLNINVVPHVRGPKANLMAGMSAWSPQERRVVRDRMEETYDLFVNRVKAGREGIDVSKTAEGRLFAGAPAIELKMADELGGADVAIRDLAAELGLAEGRYDVFDYPAPKSLDEILDQMLGGLIKAPGGAAEGRAALAAAVAGLRELVGARAWPQLRDALTAMTIMRSEPVLLVAPRLLLVR